MYANILYVIIWFKTERILTFCKYVNTKFDLREISAAKLSPETIESDSLSKRYLLLAFSVVSQFIRESLVHRKVAFSLRFHNQFRGRLSGRIIPQLIIWQWFRLIANVGLHNSWRPTAIATSMEQLQKYKMEALTESHNIRYHV